MNTGASDKKCRLLYDVAVGVAVVALIAPGVTLARDVVVVGGVNVGYEFDDRQYEDDDEVLADQEQQQTLSDIQTDNKDERYSRLRLGPLVTLTSSAPRDEIKLHYSPKFWYDFENSDNNVDHDLRASLSRYLAPNWQLKLADDYLLTDQHRYSTDTTDRTAESSDTATTTGDTGTTSDDTLMLTDTDNRRRYWTNDLSLRSEYEYLHNSQFTLGYRYNILRNIETEERLTYEDYDRHQVTSGVGHRFSPVWKLSVYGSYTRGLYDENESSTSRPDEEILEKDLDEYDAVMALQEKFLEYHQHTLSYKFYGVEYDAEERNNAYIHDITLGWQWDVSKNTLVGLGAGPSYVKPEDMDGEWQYNANMHFVYSFERGRLRFTAERGYEVFNFTGTDEDNGFREFFQTKLEFDYHLADDLSASLYTGYRNEDQDVTRITAVTVEEDAMDENDLTETDTINRERLSAGAGLAYSFWQWYKAILSYDYIRQDSELIDDSFDEHRIALTLSYETELFKW